jgi:hypothetical protein
MPGPEANIHVLNKLMKTTERYFQQKNKNLGIQRIKAD